MGLLSEAAASSLSSKSWACTGTECSSLRAFHADFFHRTVLIGIPSSSSASQRLRRSINDIAKHCTQMAHNTSCVTTVFFLFSTVAMDRYQQRFQSEPIKYVIIYSIQSPRIFQKYLSCDQGHIFSADGTFDLLSLPSARSASHNYKVKITTTYRLY